MAEPIAVRAALEREFAAPIEVRETHISVVFLTPERAFKLKKPIVLPFLDYGTPTKRRAMCEAEVRLGRRLAPDMYLGVRGVTAEPTLTTADDAEAIDYVVEMRRYDEHATLAARLGCGELRLPQITQLATASRPLSRRLPVPRGNRRAVDRARGDEQPPGAA